MVEDNSDFVNLTTALGRSCDVQVCTIRRAVMVSLFLLNELQHNQCASAANGGGDFSVGDCDAQNTACHASI